MKKKIYLGVLSFLLLVALAECLPRLLIRSGVEIYEGEAREYAGWMHMYAQLLACSGPETFICTAVRVTEIKPFQQDGCRYPFIGKVHAYTVFGIHYDTIEFDCNLNGSRN